MTDADAALSIEGLTKRYAKRTVVDHLDLNVPRGVVAGFVGPNGSGKTTTMRMLLGLVGPDSGGGTVLGQPISDPAAFLPKVGALIESPAFYPALTGHRNLRVMAALAGQDPGRIEPVLELVGLGERGGDLYRSYSLGMKQRLGIAASLLGDPDLLVLDEPANGLDPAGIREIRVLVRNLAARGTTVFISSHLLAELEQACDWLVMIDRGQSLFNGPISELLAGDDVEITIEPLHPADARALAAVLGGSGPPLTIRPDGDAVVTPANSASCRAVAARLNSEALSAGIEIAALTTTKPNLEDRFMDLVPGQVL